MSQPTSAEQLFYRARDLDPEERALFLKAACEGQPKLRNEVERLLAAEADAEAEQFLSESDPPAPPTRPGLEWVGDYRLIRLIGEGSQAAVYMARDEQLQRDVALKVLRTTFLGEASEPLQRFQREAALTASIQHPGICSIYDAGESDGVAWIAMQYVPGRTLAELLDSAKGAGPVDLELKEEEHALAAQESFRDSRVAHRGDVNRVLAFVESAARALHAAHEKGLVHRDVKPGNLMVTRDGNPVILDFGIARGEPRSDALTLTRTNATLGTPYYMAPEQVRGDARGVDQRTDVYSLGVTLYECLIGRRPFEAVSLDALYQQILQATPQAPRGLDRSIAADLQTVVMTAMAGPREQRYVSALEFAEDLRRVRTHEPVRARPVPLWGRALRWFRREPTIALSAATVLATMAVSLGVSLYFLDGTRTALRSELEVRRVSYDTLSRAIAAQDLRGQHPWMYPELEAQGTARIDSEFPGFRDTINEIDSRHWRFRDRAHLGTGSAVADLLPQLSPAVRLCAADRLHAEARSLMSMPGSTIQDEVNATGLRLARLSLQAYDKEGLSSSDERVVRGRVLLLDALLEAREFAEAESLATTFLESEGQLGSLRDQGRAALYSSRLGAALFEQGERAEALERLEASGRIVAEAYPNTFLSLGALAHLLQACDQADANAAKIADWACRKLCDGLAATTPEVALSLTQWSRWSLRVAIGSGRPKLWEWFEKLMLQGKSKLSLAEIDIIESELIDLLNGYSIEGRDSVLTLLAISLGSAANHQQEEQPRESTVPERLLRMALDLDADVPPSKDGTRSAGRVMLQCMLAMRELQKGRTTEAEELLRTALEATPPQSRIRAVTAGFLGQCLIRMKQYEEAEELLGGWYRTNAQWLGRSDSNTLQSVRELIRLYDAWGRSEEAAYWRGELDALQGP